MIDLSTLDRGLGKCRKCRICASATLSKHTLMMW